MMRSGSLVPALLMLAWTALSATHPASEVQTSAAPEETSSAEAHYHSEEECLEVLAPEVSIED